MLWDRQKCLLARVCSLVLQADLCVLVSHPLSFSIPLFSSSCFLLPHVILSFSPHLFPSFLLFSFFPSDLESSSLFFKSFQQGIWVLTQQNFWSIHRIELSCTAETSCVFKFRISKDCEWRTPTSDYIPRDQKHWHECPPVQVYDVGTRKGMERWNPAFSGLHLLCTWWENLCYKGKWWWIKSIKAAFFSSANNETCCLGGPSYRCCRTTWESKNPLYAVCLVGASMC